jgi:hypothetical protein
MSNDLRQMAQPAVDALLPLDEQQLFSELGARVKAIEKDPTQGGDFALEAATEEGPFEAAVDFSEVGRRFFDNLSLAAYSLLCGGDGNADVKKLMEQGTNALAAGIAGVLVAQLGIAAAIAAAVAAIIVKLFFDAGTKTLCQTWKQHLPKPEGQAGSQAPAGNA